MRQERKKAKLLEMGFTDVVIKKDSHLQTEAQFDKIFELVGPATLADSIHHLKKGGIVCSTGQLGGQWYLEEFDPIIVLGKGVYLTSFYSENVEHGKLQDLFDYIKKHQVQMKPERLFYLHDIQEAHRYLESQEAFGKVVVINDK